MKYLKIKDLLIEYTKKIEPVSETARLDIEVLLMHALKIDDKVKLFLKYEEKVREEEFKEFEKLVEKRIKKMPIAYIINKKEFMGFDFYVNNNVLIPRPDTEILVERALKEIKYLNEELNIIDMCCGSGAIGLSIAKILEGRKEKINYYLVDISSKALKVAKKNMEMFQLNNIKLINSDLFSSDELKFLRNNTSIILSNPPYIEKKIIETLEDDVKNYEPLIALDGGDSGMDFYNKIIEESLKFLKDNGILIFESGHNQGEKIINKMKTCGFRNMEMEKDLQGFNRVVIAKK